MARRSREEPTVADVLAWMRDIPSPSWAAAVRDVEYAVSEIKEEARLAARRVSTRRARGARVVAGVAGQTTHEASGPGVS